jgi:hypothetical protein
MALTPATNKQIPEHSILDHFGKQVYLGNQFVYGSPSQASVGTGENPLFLLTCPAQPTIVPPRSIFQELSLVSMITASQTVIVRLYLNPTVTSLGTPVTPVNLRPASPTTSIAVASAAPSVSSNGTFIWATASVSFSPDIVQMLTILDPGNSLLITTQASATGNMAYSINWLEQ